MPHIDFSIMGLDEYADEFLNWCMMYRDNLEMQRKKEVMEIWQQKGEKGNAILNFNEKGKLLKVNKNLFS